MNGYCCPNNQFLAELSGSSNYSTLSTPKLDTFLVIDILDLVLLNRPFIEMNNSNKTIYNIEVMNRIESCVRCVYEGPVKVW